MNITNRAWEIFSHYHDLVMFFIDLSCTVFPTFGYLDQLGRIIKTKSSENFKIDSSIVLLLSNYLRIIYWYWKQFDSYLLWQSIWMIGVQLTLAFVYYYYKPDILGSQNDQEESSDTGKIESIFPKNFLQFMVCVIVFALVLITTAIGLHSVFDANVIIEGVGVLSNLIDCVVTLPQFILVVIQREIKYVTVPLLLQWILALGCKLTLYIMRPVPLPFMLGLSVQAFLTFFIVFSYLFIRISKIGSKESDVSVSYDAEFEEVENDKSIEA